jgi:signal peptidase I
VKITRVFVFGTFEIPSGSMENTLKVGDKILVSKLAPSPFFKIHRGDIVVFHDPGGWLSDNPRPTGWHLFLLSIGIPAGQNDDLEFLVKRVIGVPGDHITCEVKCKQIKINNVPIDESGYLKEPSNPASDVSIDVTVPDNMLFVMGDNRGNSADSRYNEGTPLKGFVPIDNVVGTAKIIFSPLSDFRIIKKPSDVFANVDK